jgi:hypothetical protein
MDPRFFVNRTAVHEKEVALANGSKHKLWFREVSSADWARYRGRVEQAQKLTDGEDRAIAMQAATCMLIGISLCEPDGTPAIDDAKAQELAPVVIDALIQAVLEVNRYKPGN